MIGILIVAHGAFGEALIHSASHVLGKRPVRVRQVGVTVHDDPEAILPQARDLVRQLDEGRGVLVLTDIYGATPGNIALKLLVPGGSRAHFGRQPADADPRADLRAGPARRWWRRRCRAAPRA
jgi:mannose/fructose-specific phosphotransferase system component IIA